MSAVLASPAAAASRTIETRWVDRVWSGLRWGLMLFFITLCVIVRERDVLAGAAVGLIPLAIGIGFFVDYNLQKRELSRFGMEIDQPN